jgi:hypothetical protein
MMPPVFIVTDKVLCFKLPTGPICLVFDQYRPHITTGSEEAAGRLEIRLIRGRGATGIWHPLRRRLDLASQTSVGP